MNKFLKLNGKTIVVCLPGRTFSANFLNSWTDLISVCKNIGIKLYLSCKYTSNVYFVRSMCLGADVLKGKIQRPFNGQVDYDYIMWIDSDIVFTPEQVLEMVLKMENNNKYQILSGLYAMEGGKQFACVKDMDENYFKNMGSFDFLKVSNWDKLKKLEPFAVDYNGMGFMLVKKGVYESIEYPWFEPRFFEYNKNNNIIRDFCSEDVGFCLKAKENGILVYLDPSIRVGHEKSIIL